MNFLRILYNILLSWIMPVFGSLGTAEVRMYDWDGAADLWTRTSWTDLYGAPYEIQVDAGLVVTTKSGWVNVVSIGQLTVSVIVRGLDASCAGQVTFQFQAANSFRDPAQQWEREDLAVSVDTNGTTPANYSQDLDVSGVAWLRVSKITSLASHNVMAGVKCGSQAKPYIA